MTKSVSAKYEREEKRHERKPIELFYIWCEGGPSWRYTNTDRGYNYNGNKYIPAAIARGTVQYNAQLDVSTMFVEADRLLRPVVKFMAQNPLDIVWVQALRVFRRQAVTDAGVIFIGMISDASFQGQRGKINCVGLEYFLKQEVPIFRYHPPCNHTLFDTNCGVDSSSFRVQNVTLATVSSNGLTLTTTDATLLAEDDDWATLGYLEWSGAKRMITSHTKSGGMVTLELQYKIPDLTAGNSVTVYAGCDLKAETCRDKFSNLDSFLGFLYVPSDNPVMRT